MRRSIEVFEVPIMRKTIDLNHPANSTEVSRWNYRFIGMHTLSSFWLQNGMALVMKWYGFWLQPDYVVNN